MAVNKIYVVSYRGLVGSAIVRTLGQQGQTNFVARTHVELDPANEAAVQGFFEESLRRPTWRCSPSSSASVWLII